MEELSNCKSSVKGVVMVLARGRAVTKDENVLDGEKKTDHQWTEREKQDEGESKYSRGAITTCPRKRKD